MDERRATDGILLEHFVFRIRAVALDHHTLVLAYADAPDEQIKIRKGCLIARELEPGPRLNEL